MLVSFIVTPWLAYDNNGKSMKLPVLDSSISMQNTSILIKVDLQNTKKNIGFQLTILEKLDGGKRKLYLPTSISWSFKAIPP